MLSKHIGRFIFLHARQKCTDSETVSTLLKLAYKDPKTDNPLLSDFSDYMPSMRVVNSTRSYSRGNQEICNAKINVTVDDRIAKFINELNANKSTADAMSIRYANAINNINWNPKEGYFTMDVEFAADENKISVGGAEVMSGWFQLKTLLIALKNIDIDSRVGDADKITSNNIEKKSSLDLDLDFSNETFELDETNIDKAVSFAVKNYKDSGISAVAKNVSDCWSKFDSKVTSLTEAQKYHFTNVVLA